MEFTWSRGKMTVCLVLTVLMIVSLCFIGLLGMKMLALDWSFDIFFWRTYYYWSSLIHWSKRLFGHSRLWALSILLCFILIYLFPSLFCNIIIDSSFLRFNLQFSITDALKWGWHHMQLLCDQKNWILGAFLLSIVPYRFFTLTILCIVNLTTSC